MFKGKTVKKILISGFALLTILLTTPLHAERVYLGTEDLRKLDVPPEEEVMRMAALVTSFSSRNGDYEEELKKNITYYNRRKIKRPNYEAFAIDLEAIQSELSFDILNRLFVLGREEAQRKGQKVDAEKVRPLTREQIREHGEKDPLIWKIRHMLAPKYINGMTKLYYRMKGENLNMKPCAAFERVDTVETICLEKVSQDFISYRSLQKYDKRAQSYASEYRKIDGVWTHTGIKVDTSQLDGNFFVFLGMWK